MVIYICLYICVVVYVFIIAAIKARMAAVIAFSFVVVGRADFLFSPFALFFFFSSYVCFRLLKLKAFFIDPLSLNKSFHPNALMEA